MDLLCGQCGRTLRVADALAGSQTRCEHCGGIVNVPRLDAEGVERPIDGVLTRLSDEEGDLADEFLAKAKLALKKKMLVVCGSCGERLTVEQRLAGKMSQCPACGEAIRIPPELDEQELEQARQKAESEGLAEALDFTAELNQAVASEPAPPAAAVPQETPVFPQELAIAPRGSAGLGGTRRLSAPRRRGGIPAAAWFVVALVIGLAGLIGGWIAWREHDNRQANRPSAQAPAPTPEVRPSNLPERPVGPVKAPEPPSLPELPVAELDPRPGPVPPAEVPVSVLTAKLSLVAGSSLLPAPAGQAYLVVQARILAKGAELTVETSPAVAVETAKGRFVTLGIPGGDGLLSAPARQATLKIPPTAGRLETLVFLVPEETREGVLKIADVGEARLPTLAAPSTTDAAALAGKYVEARRFLRVAFDDPVMERVRGAPRHGLTVQAGGDSADVSLPPTDLRGQVKRNVPSGRNVPPGPLSASAWQGTLSAGGESIPCQLRLEPGGKHLILYLADGPFHQVVYERQQ